MPAISPHLDDRERSRVEQVLRTAPLAWVAMVETVKSDSAPRPYVMPMNFAYEPPSGGTVPNGIPALEGRLLLHTGPGRKARALAANPRVCVSVIAQEQLHLGATPCDDGYRYASVILEGRAVLLTDCAEREQALRVIVAKYDPAAADKPFKPQVFARTLMYAFEAETIGFKERPKHR